MLHTVADLEEQNQELFDSKTILEADNIALRTQLEKLQSSLNNTSALVKRGEDERLKLLCLLNEALAQKRQLSIDLKRMDRSPTRKQVSPTRRTQEKRVEPTHMDKEVIVLVAELIQQTLAIAGDCIEHFLSKGMVRPNAKSETDKLLVKEVTEVLGGSLVAIVTSINHHQTPRILRVAIQAALANQLFDFFEFWPTPYSHAFSDEYRKVWDGIKKNENSTTAAQWRSLSIKYIRSELTLEAQLHDESVNASIRAIAKVLRASGIPHSIPDLIQQCREELGASIASLWKSAGALAQKVKESFTSDYQLVFSSPGEGYNPETQTSWYSGVQDVKRMSARVACTTHVGVQRSTVNGNHVLSSGGTRPLILSRATVVMDHEVFESLPLD